MGKVKTTKKHRKKLTQKAEPVQISGHDGFKVDTHNVVCDISSMDPKRRERACVVIANIFMSESNNSSVVDRMSTSDLLGKLCMRLIDSSENVRTHAAGALRAPVVSQRMIDAGIVGTLVSLVSEGLQSPLTPSSSIYIEQLISTASNLCASCEAAVDEVLNKQFLSVLLQAIHVPSVPPPLKTAAVCCLYTTTDNHTPSCEYLFSVPDGMSILLCAASTSTSTSTSAGDSASDSIHNKTVQLYAVGALANIYLSFLAACRADSNHAQDASVQTLLSEATVKMQDVLQGVLSSLELREEILAEILSPSVDENSENPLGESALGHHRSTASAAATAVAVSSSNDTSNSAGDEGDEENGVDVDKGDLVLVGKDVDRTWALEIDVVEIAAEILANMACVVRNTFHDEILQHPQHSSDDGIGADLEWNDDDESEERMEALAKSVGGQRGRDGRERCVGAGSKGVGLAFDTHRAVGATLASLEQLINSLVSITTRTQQQGLPFTSPGLELLTAVDRVLVALTNLIYLMDNWPGDDLADVLHALLKTFDALSEIFNGVSDVTSFDEEGKSVSSNWLISPMVSIPALSRAVRSCLVTCAQALSTLHEGQKEGLCVGLQTASGEQYEALRRFRVGCLGKGVSALPILEVMQPCFEVISQLAEIVDESSGSPILSADVVQELIQRCMDPSAMRTIDSEYTSLTRPGSGSLVDASLLVMEGCLSTLIDLHSSDDLALFQIYVDLNMASQLQDASQAFRNKLRVDGAASYDREDLGRCKETLLNLNRFIKYKADFRSSL